MSVAASGPAPAAANSLSTLLRWAAVVTSAVAAAVAVSGCGDNLVPPDALPACSQPIAPYGTIEMFASTHAVRTQDGAGKQTIAFLGAVQPGPTADTLDIQLIQGNGAFANGPPAAGMYSLTGAEAQLATCGVCVVIEAGMPREYYVAQRGTLAIQDAGTRFQAALSDVELAHVTVDPLTSMSTIVDSCQTSITGAMWDTPIN
jgi:hypothetical protein